VSVYFDAGPRALGEWDRKVKLEDGVVRCTVMRARDWGEKVNVTKDKKNPFRGEGKGV